MMEDLFTCKLEESRQKRKLLSIYDDKNDIYSFRVGIVIMMFSDSVLIVQFNKRGESNGYILLRLVDIFKIEEDTKYLIRWSALLSLETDFVPFQTGSVPYPRWIEDYGIDYIIEMCNIEKKMVTIWLIYEDSFTGFITYYNGNELLVSVYTDQGIFDGVTVVEYKNIRSLAFASANERAVMRMIGHGGNAL